MKEAAGIAWDDDVYAARRVRDVASVAPLESDEAVQTAPGRGLGSRAS